MLSAILSGAGSLFNVIGAIGSKNAAIRNEQQLKSFNARQAADFGATSESLLSQAKKMSTYKSDISRFEGAQSLAETQARTVGTAPIGGQLLAEENVRKSMANAVAKMSQSARSSTDILSSILAGTEAGNESLRAIDIAGMEQRGAQSAQARQNLLAASQATASAAERGGMQEFESVANKQRTELSLTQNLAQARLNMQQQQFEAERSAAMDVARSKAAIWSGFGQMLGAAGQGIAQTEMLKGNMKFIKELSNDGVGQSISRTSSLLNTVNQLGVGIGQANDSGIYGKQYTTIGAGSLFQGFRR